MARVKKLFRRNSFVTILGVILIITVAYFGFQYRLNLQTQPIDVPFAKEDIGPLTEITPDLFEHRKITRAAVGDNVYTKISDIIGKYTKANYTIPAGSMFYKSAIAESGELTSGTFLSLKEGEVAHTLKVDDESAYGDAISPNLRVDLYYRGPNAKGEKIYKKFVENVRVLAVKDANGKDLGASNDQKPAYIIIAVSEEVGTLLGKAKMISGVSFEPKITSEAFKIEGSHTAPNTEVKNYINSKIGN